MNKKINNPFLIPTYEKVINSMTELVCVVGMDGRVVLANSALTRVTGIDVGDDCPASSSCTECDGRCKYVLECRHADLEFEKNGRVYKVKINPMGDKAGECFYILQTWIDVTGEAHLKNKLQSQNSSMKKDLEVARSLQQSMLIDQLPKTNNIRFSALYNPCDSVGGDFYEVFETGENEVTFYMADVSGHGVSAAMLTVFFAQAVDQIMHNRKHALKPHEILTQVWTQFLKLDLEEHFYITAWMGTLNGLTGELEYCNAGHISSPVVAEGQEYKRIEMPGFPICKWMEDPEFKTNSLILEKETKMLLFTDGLSDAWRLKENKDDIYGGINAAEDVAISHVLKDKFDKCLENIWVEISRGMNDIKLNDDVAMLLLEYK